MASIPEENISPAVLQTYRPILQELYQTARDPLSHSSADLLLRRWDIVKPETPMHTKPDAKQEWCVNSLGMTMVKIPTGRYTVSNELDQSIQFTENYLLANREVTQAQFEQFAVDQQ